MSEEVKTFDCLVCGTTGLCPRCDGAGTITIKKWAVTCAKCKGTGLCPACKGTGEVTIRIIKPK